MNQIFILIVHKRWELQIGKWPPAYIYISVAKCRASIVGVMRLAVAATSGVARTSPMLGHSMGTLRLYEFPHEVQKLKGVWGHPPPENLQLPRSVLRSYSSEA